MRIVSVIVIAALSVFSSPAKADEIDTDFLLGSLSAWVRFIEKTCGYKPPPALQRKLNVAAKDKGMAYEAGFNATAVEISVVMEDQGVSKGVTTLCSKESISSIFNNAD